MLVSLGQAARLAGRGKTTLTRAIQTGRLSATRRSDGSYEIETSELARVYGITLPAGETPSGTPETVSAVHHETRNQGPRDSERDPETVARLAGLEAEIAGLKALIAEVRQSRDDWKSQAERLALSPPPAPSTTWWRRLVG